MATRKVKARPTRKSGVKVKKARKSVYTSPGWERIAAIAVDLDGVAIDLGLNERPRDPDGFDLADAAKELARLASNFNRVANPDGRNLEAEKSDWVSVAGIGADLGNMAEEESREDVADRVKVIAHELCYRACNYLF